MFTGKFVATPVSVDINSQLVLPGLDTPDNDLDCAFTTAPTAAKGEVAESITIVNGELELVTVMVV